MASAGAAALARGDFAAAAAALAAAAHGGKPQDEDGSPDLDDDGGRGRSAAARASAARAAVKKALARSDLGAAARLAEESLSRREARAYATLFAELDVPTADGVLGPRDMRAALAQKLVARARRVIARQRASKRPRAAAADADADGVEDLDALFGAPATSSRLPRRSISSSRRSSSPRAGRRSSRLTITTATAR